MTVYLDTETTGYDELSAKSIEVLLTKTQLKKRGYSDKEISK
ncbi:hypothetical protein [Photorhabdus tasmaniensis]|nr:hypothetical protein [Photorhabdus tasmaniensis]